MPYRIDLEPGADADVAERLIELGALDVESSADGRVAALLPDSVGPEEVKRTLGRSDIVVSAASGRDEGSVWVLSARPVRIGRLSIVPAHLDAEPGALRLIDAAAFGTGLHPTTALCLEALEDVVRIGIPGSVLDVGTGSGVLALAALVLGVPHALALDVEVEALNAAADNARLNGLADRLQLARGGPETVTGRWPLVLANILAAPLIEMASPLSRCVGHQGELVLSGIPASVERAVIRAYRDLGMHCVDVKSRDEWVAVTLRASW